ncbi:MAG: mandelate racemase/muconate lactonizing enzyme family protein [Chloroflexi bacterium]|nr:mandelate racemase/muconate lactonizing enzyme family protein [Chloroflexota bacterium]
MKITDIRTDLLKNGRMLLRVYTDQGIVGLAEAPGRTPKVTAAYFEEQIKPLLVGRDPRQTNQIWEVMFFGPQEGFPPRLPIQVVGAIDIACWDILGKSTAMPCFDLLGGAARTKIPLYWSVGNGWKKTPEQMLADVKPGWEQGFRAFKIRMDWRAHRQDANPGKDFQMFKLVREFLPQGIYLGFDANNGYSVKTAITQGHRFEELGIDHFEEPLPQYDLPGLRQVVDALEVAISTGEQEQTRWRFRDLIDLANPDILQPDILNAGGISEVKRIYEIAVTENKPVMPHSPSSGINALASLHAFATVTNGVRPHEFSVEFGGTAESIAELFKEPVLPEKGSITLPNRPGLGLELNEKALSKFLA